MIVSTVVWWCPLRLGQNILRLTVKWCWGT